MVKLNDDMVGEIKESKLFFLATASKNGEPNVVPIGMLILQEDHENVWIVDNFMKKTHDNLKENPIAAFSVYNKDGKCTFQIKGKVTIENSGKDYEWARDFAHAKKKELPAKNLVKMKIEKVYSVQPGPDAGKLILS